jgi:light-regulated signal transduction histidine kinase (bacteriophytochrome)
VTDRKNFELVLQKSNLALKRSNEDLAQFAHAASHDLQEPLRTIAIYTQLLAKQHGAQLDAKANEYLRVIQAAATRMLRLIEDLLTFSEARGNELHPDRLFPATDMVRGAIENLKNAIDESGAIISCEALPVIAVDAAQFTMVLQNLIANAIKYRKPDEAPRIEIGAKEDGKYWIFSVRDNGMGFKQAHAEQIFSAFKRLHGREIPGTGMGLAIVKKVIERHEGQVWAESEPGCGATFFLRLPMPDVIHRQGV